GHSTPRAIAPVPSTRVPGATRPGRPCEPVEKVLAMIAIPIIHAVAVVAAIRVTLRAPFPGTISVRRTTGLERAFSMGEPCMLSGHGVNAAAADTAASPHATCQMVY